jgi:hypothetical protein
MDAQPPVPPPPSGDPSLPPRTVGDVLSTAFDIYRRNAAKLLTIVAVVVIPLSLISFLIVQVALAPGTTETVIGGRVVEVPEGRSFGVFLLAALVAAAIAVIINAILQAALIRGAARATLGEPVDVTDSYRWGLRRFGSVLLVAFLVAIVTGIGFLLLIIPGIIFLAMFSVSIPAVVVEGKRGTAAMGRSWNLVKGHFWHVLGVVVAAFIIVAVVGYILGLIGRNNDVVRAIVQIIGQIITAPFSALVTVVLYLDLRTRVENLTMTTLRSELEQA